MNELLGRLHLESAMNEKSDASRLIDGLQEHAANTFDEASRLVAEHPLAAVAGCAVAGFLLGSMLPRSKS